MADWGCIVKCVTPFRHNFGGRPNFHERNQKIIILMCILSLKPEWVLTHWVQVDRNKYLLLLLISLQIFWFICRKRLRDFQNNRSGIIKNKNKPATDCGLQQFCSPPEISEIFVTLRRRFLINSATIQITHLSRN